MAIRYNCNIYCVIPYVAYNWLNIASSTVLRFFSHPRLVTIKALLYNMCDL